MKHQQFQVTVLAASLIILAMLFSESTPASWFESGILQQASSKHLYRISGMECNCKPVECVSPGNQRCVWVPLVPDPPGTSLGECGGCTGLGEHLTAKYGSDLVCYNGDTPDGSFFGCCEKECKELGCPEECETFDLIPNWEKCTPMYASGCNDTRCWRKANDFPL